MTAPVRHPAPARAYEKNWLDNAWRNAGRSQRESKAVLRTMYRDCLKGRGR